MEMKAPSTTTQPQPPSGGLEREAEAMSARRKGKRVRVKRRDERKHEDVARAVPQRGRPSHPYAKSISA